MSHCRSLTWRSRVLPKRAPGPGSKQQPRSAASPSPLPSGGASDPATFPPVRLAPGYLDGLHQGIWATAPSPPPRPDAAVFEGRTFLTEYCSHIIIQIT